MSNNDRTFKQSIRWISFQESHQITSARVNINYTFTYIATTQNEHRCYSAKLFRSLHRCKRCTSPEDVMPSAHIHVDAALVDCI